MISSIKEVKVEVQLDETGAAIIETEKIEGILHGVIIDSDSICNIKVSLAEYEDVILFHRAGYAGQKYLSLRNDSTFFDNEKAQSNGAKWLLNDNIRIFVEGSIYSTVKFIFRYI